MSNKTFKLASGEEADITLDFFVKETLAPDLYLGKLVIETLTQSKEILIVMEVESDKSLFDVKAEIDKRYKNIRRGEEVIAKVELFNLGSSDRVDVMLEYIFKDSEGNELLREHEIVAVEAIASFLKEFKIPYSFEEGEYVLYVRVVYGDEVASASSWFSIKERVTVPWKIGILYFILFFIVFTIIRLYQLYIKEQRKERVKKYEEEEEREEKRKQVKIKPKHDVPVKKSMPIKKS